MGQQVCEVAGPHSQWQKVSETTTSANSSLDSPTAYVDALNKLCQSSQTLGKLVLCDELTSDQHLLSFTGTKTPAYAELPSSASNHIELRLRRSSEFFGALIVPFVVEDLKTLLVSIPI